MQDLYLLTQNEEWLHQAEGLIKLCNKRFFHPESGYYTYAEKGLQTQIDLTDNVQPSSNVIMTQCLLRQAFWMNNVDYQAKANAMLQGMYTRAEKHPSMYAHWLYLFIAACQHNAQTVAIGPKVSDIHNKLKIAYHAEHIWAISISISSLPIFKDKTTGDDTFIYECSNNTCRLPTVVK